MLAQIGQLLIDTVFGLLVYVLLIRFYLQVFRAPFRNPVGQFVVAISNWIVLPARRVIPGLKGMDLSTLVLAWLLEMLAWLLGFWLRGFSFGSAPGIAFGVLAALAVLELVRLSLYLLIGVVIVQVILSWVSPYTPMAPIFDALTRPFYRPFRRLVPPIANIDLSPLFVVLVAQILLIPLAALTRAVASPF